ncbi:hypothetical protein vseg_000368 [Gypsophila vaccaria]
MSNRSKNFRRRGGGGGGSDDDNNNDSSGSTIPKSAAKPKKNHQKLLSFVEDEDESPFSRPSKPSSSSSSSARVPKSSGAPSHRVVPMKDRIAASSTSLQSNVQPSAGQYTKEALLELQKNTRTLASSRTRPKPPPEPVVVLKGAVKPEFRVGADGASDEGDDDDEDDRKAMPDQARINEIKAKRERLRQSRAPAADYIALDSGSNHGAAEGLSDEEPEFQTRIAMFEDGGRRGKKGVFEDVAGAASSLSAATAGMSVGDGGEDGEDEDEEEERKWEEEQFRKGLGKRMEEGPAVGVNVHAQAVQQQSYTVSYSSAGCVANGAAAPSIGGAVGFGAVSISEQAEVAKQALKNNMSRLKESHGKTLSSLSQVEENLLTALTNITTLDKSSSLTGEKYIFMQKLRDFIAVICDFLQHKAPYIEELEEQMQQLHKKRASAVLKRRAADNDDEMAEAQAAVDAAMSMLGRGGGNAATIAAAMSAAQAAVAAIKEHKNLPVMLDDFGRDLNRQKRMDTERRAKAREERRNRSEKKRMASVGSDISYQRMEGESSTDDSENENDAYKSNHNKLLQVAEEIFSDAAEEYSQLSAVKEIFERWKRLYAESYRDAFTSLSIPSIFSPYVRLELLKWDPLHEDVDFFDMRWHSLLFDYGVPADGSDFSADDVDADLIPGLVEKVALPILHHDIAHCWDMLSGRESKNAVSATSVIVNYVPVSSEALKELITTIRARLAEAVATLVVPTWSATVMKAVPNAARIVAYRFGVALRLMRNICMWKDILVMPALETLVLDEILCGKVLPHLQNLTSDMHDAVARAERVIASLTGVWTGPSVTGARSPKLQPLVNYVLTLSKNLEKRHASGAPESEVNGIARRLKKMLVELNEYDEARSINRTFHLREAL